MEDKELLIRLDERLKSTNKNINKRFKSIETSINNHLKHHEDSEKSMRKAVWALIIMVGGIIGKAFIVWLM